MTSHASGGSVVQHERLGDARYLAQILEIQTCEDAALLIAEKLPFDGTHSRGEHRIDVHDQPLIRRKLFLYAAQWRLASMTLLRQVRLMGD